MAWTAEREVGDPEAGYYLRLLLAWLVAGKAVMLNHVLAPPRLPACLAGCRCCGGTEDLRSHLPSALQRKHPHLSCAGWAGASWHKLAAYLWQTCAVAASYDTTNQSSQTTNVCFCHHCSLSNPWFSHTHHCSSSNPWFPHTTCRQPNFLITAVSFRPAVFPTRAAVLFGPGNLCFRLEDRAPACNIPTGQHIISNNRAVSADLLLGQCLLPPMCAECVDASQPDPQQLRPPLLAKGIEKAAVLV